MKKKYFGYLQNNWESSDLNSTKARSFNAPNFPLKKQNYLAFHPGLALPLSADWPTFLSTRFVRGLMEISAIMTHI